MKQVLFKLPVNRAAILPTSFFMLSFIIAGFSCRMQFSEDSQTFFARCFMGMSDEAGVFAALMRIMWWRVGLWMLASASGCWPVALPLQLMSVMMLGGCFGLGWSCVLAGLGARLVWVIPLFVAAGGIFFACSSVFLAVCANSALSSLYFCVTGRRVWQTEPEMTSYIKKCAETFLPMIACGMLESIIIILL